MYADCRRNVKLMGSVNRGTREEYGLGTIEDPEEDARESVGVEEVEVWSESCHEVEAGVCAHEWMQKLQVCLLTLSQNLYAVLQSTLGLYLHPCSYPCPCQTCRNHAPRTPADGTVHPLAHPTEYPNSVCREHQTLCPLCRPYVYPNPSPCPYRGHSNQNTALFEVVMAFCCAEAGEKSHRERAVEGGVSAVSDRMRVQCSK